MAKPMVVTLPFVLLLLDVWPLGRVRFARDGLPAWRRSSLEKMPLVVLALATSVATIVVQHRVGAMAGLDALPWICAPPMRSSPTCEYLVEGALAVASGGVLSVPRRFLVACLGAALIADRDHGRRRCGASRWPYLLVGWVVVSRHAVAGHRASPGRRAADGGSVHVRAADRTVGCRVVGTAGSRRDAVGADRPRAAGGGSSRWSSAVRVAARGAGGALVRQRRALAACDARHARQLHCLREPGPGAAGTRRAGRRGNELPAGAGAGAGGVAGVSGGHPQQPGSRADAAGSLRCGRERLRGSGAAAIPGSRRRRAISATRSRGRASSRRRSITTGRRSGSSRFHRGAGWSRKCARDGAAGRRRRPPPTPMRSARIRRSRRRTTVSARHWPCWDSTTAL